MWLVFWISYFSDKGSMTELSSPFLTKFPWHVFQVWCVFSVIFINCVIYCVIYLNMICLCLFYPLFPFWTWYFRVHYNYKPFFNELFSEELPIMEYVYTQVESHVSNIKKWVIYTRFFVETSDLIKKYYQSPPPPRQVSLSLSDRYQYFIRFCYFNHTAYVEL